MLWLLSHASAARLPCVSGRGPSMQPLLPAAVRLHRSLCVPCASLQWAGLCHVRFTAEPACAFAGQQKGGSAMLFTVGMDDYGAAIRVPQSTACHSQVSLQHACCMCHHLVICHLLHSMLRPAQPSQQAADAGARKYDTTASPQGQSHYGLPQGPVEQLCQQHACKAPGWSSSPLAACDAAFGMWHVQ